MPRPFTPFRLGFQQASSYLLHYFIKVYVWILKYYFFPIIMCWITSKFVGAMLECHKFVGAMLEQMKVENIKLSILISILYVIHFINWLHINNVCLYSIKHYQEDKETLYTRPTVACFYVCICSIFLLQASTTWIHYILKT